jgi:hypothetical protein
MKDKYGVSKVFYFGGVETHDFVYDYLSNPTVPIDKLERYLKQLIETKGKTVNEAQLLLLGRHLQRIRFYKKLEQKWGRFSTNLERKNFQLSTIHQVT